MKSLGAVILLLTAVLYIWQEWRRGQRQVAYLTAWGSLLRGMRTQISCYATPLSEILKNTDRAILEVACDDPAPERSLPQLCAQAARKMSGESAREMAALADELGTVWRQEQLIRLDEVIATLERERQSALAARAGHMRLVSALSICGTLGVLLLLW